MPAVEDGTFLYNLKRDCMKLSSRCIPLGALPYDNIDLVTKFEVKLYQNLPFLPLLPKISEADNLVSRTLENIPGIKIENKKVKIKIASNHYKKGMTKLEAAFNHPTLENLEYFAFESPFLEKFFQLIKKFESPNAVVNFLGPFSISQMLINAAEEEMLVDKTYRKLFIQAVCVKALWIIEKIKEANPSTVPLIILEEPLLGKLGEIKRENEEITNDIVISLLARVIDKLKEAGANVGVQCLDKCDWKIPIAAGVDLISLDAYNNPNNLCIIPEPMTEFIARGGKINWGIVPVTNEAIIKSLNIDYVEKRLNATLEGFILSGVTAPFAYNSAFVSIQGDTDSLPIIFAEKAIILSKQLSKRIPIKS